jgi:hypothetical protein
VGNEKKQYSTTKELIECIGRKLRKLIKMKLKRKKEIIKINKEIEFLTDSNVAKTERKNTFLTFFN